MPEVDQTLRREYVPTEREQRLGAPIPEPPDAVFERARHTRIPLVATIAAFVRAANPRTIDGPGLPLLVLGGMAFVVGWDIAAQGVLLPDMKRDLGVDLGFLAVLVTVMTIVDFMVAPAVGYLADRLPRVWFVRTGSVLGGITRLATGLAGGPAPLVGLRAGSGLAKGISDPAAFPMLTDHFELANRARAFAFLFAAGAVGGVVGPAIAGVLSNAFGWRSAFVALGAVGTLLALTTFWLSEPARGGLDRAAMGEPGDEEHVPVTWGEAWRAARSIVTLRRLWLATPFLYGASALGLPVLLGLYWHDVFGIGSGGRGALGTAGAASGLLALALAGPIAERLLRDRPGRVMTLLGGLVLMQAGGLVVLAFSPWLALSIVAALVLNFASFLLIPALVTLISLIVPARIRGLGIQTAAPWQLAGVALFGTIIGLGQDWSARTLLAVFAPIVAVGGVVLGSAAFGVERDIRAALAASVADIEARRARAAGRAKMLVCRDVGVGYDGVQVLFGIDLDVDEGEILALVGTNGAGKSTLLRAVCGLQESSSGAIFLDGDDITHVPPHELVGRGVVMMPGGQAIFPTLSVEENLRTAAWLRRDDETAVRASIERVLTLFPGLRARVGDVAGNLSGGQQQMVALGQALVMQPRLLMIDELSLGLGPAIVEQLLATLREIHAQGTTIVLVEQSINVALTIAERAVFLERGEIRYDGPVADLLRHPELVRATFFRGASALRGGAGPPSSSPPSPAAPAGGGGRRSRTTTQGVASGEVALHVTGARKAFGGVVALRGASLSVRAGEVVGIIGPNGAGKTTLFDVVSGITPLDVGRVELAGLDISRLSFDRRARLGLGRSFQNVRLFPSLTVRECVMVALERHLALRSAALAAVWAPALRRSERRAARRVERLLDVLGLASSAEKFVSELSTGTRRAVDIACVMAAEPRVLLLDEPSSGLAQAETEQLGPLVTSLVRDTGCAVLIIEHDVPLVSSISDHMVAMDLGAVLASGTPTEVVNDARVVEAYLAASPDVVARSDALAAALASSRTPGFTGPPTEEEP